jgi:hypothetical protein
VAAHDAAVVDPETLADRLMLLVEETIATAHIEGDQLAATRARSAAATLLNGADHPDGGPGSSRSADRLQ